MFTGMPCEIDCHVYIHTVLCLYLYNFLKTLVTSKTLAHVISCFLKSIESAKNSKGKLSMRHLNST